MFFVIRVVWLNCSFAMVSILLALHRPYIDPTSTLIFIYLSSLSLSSLSLSSLSLSFYLPYPYLYLRISYSILGYHSIS